MGYNFSTMKEQLWAIAMLYAFLPINGQEKATQSNTQQNAPTTHAGTTQPPPATSLTVTVVNQQTAKDEKHRPKDEPKGYFGTLISANNLPNLLLVPVGIVGIGVALSTLSSIRNQAEEMRLQRLAMSATLTAINQQVGLMKRQADAMDRQNKAIRARERARIAITIDPETSSPESIVGKYGEGQVDYSLFKVFGFIQNNGNSNAFSVRSMSKVSVTRTVPTNLEPYTKSFSLPEVISPAQKPLNISMSNQGEYVMIPTSSLTDVYAEEAFLSMAGRIDYRDVYGQKRFTTFRYLWRVANRTNGQFRGEWIRHGTAGENYEA